MLPNFLIIGAQKAATSWLASCLGEHPDVYVAEAKEIHFFNNHFDKGTDWYASHFSRWSGQPLMGEATPGYLNHPAAPERIKLVLGAQVKLIASLRHPVDRAYSAFWHYIQRAKIPADADFHTYFQKDERYGLRSRGYYFAQLSRYFEHFPRGNVQILIYEDIKQNGQHAIDECLTFLGVDAHYVPSGLDAQRNRARNVRRFHSQAVAMRRGVASMVGAFPRRLREPLLEAGRRAFEHLILRRLPRQNDYVSLDPELREELAVEYRQDMLQLETLLGRDLSFWYAPSRQA